MRYLCNSCVMQWISPAKHQQICRQSTSHRIAPLLLLLLFYLRNQSFRVVELDRSDELLVNCDKWQVFIILYYKTVNVIVKQKPHYNRPSKLFGASPPLSAQASCTPDMEYVIAVASHIVQSVFDHNQKWIVIFISCCEGPVTLSHPGPLSGWWVPYDSKVRFYKNTFWII